MNCMMSTINERPLWMSDVLHAGKGIAQLITQVTFCLALGPLVGYGLWLILGRPFDEGDGYPDQVRE
jgi:hypothetical protein